MARLNENENENESSDNRSGLFAGSRYNTYKIAKQAFSVEADKEIRAPKIPKYKEMGGWDVENKGWVYIVDFMAVNPAWFDQLRAVAAAKWSAWAAGAAADTPTNLRSALLDMIDAAGEREDRFAEILHQQDAEGCISYFTSALKIEPGTHRHTYELLRLARKLGEMVVMCLKDSFDAARPSQLSPAIVPMFDPPRTATFPAGHSLQSYLMAYLLVRIMPRLPQSAPPAADTWRSVQEADQHRGVFGLARRIADNRVIAGVHFDIDCEAGFLVARRMNDMFDTWLAGASDASKAFAQLLADAKKEFPQYQAD